MARNYNWAILGPGRIARKFAHDLSLLPNATLHAVGSRNHDRAAAFSREFNVLKTYDNYEALAEDEDTDIVYISSLHTSHYRDTMLCLEHGKHVLCEKPVAMNHLQLEKMLSLAREKKVFFMEALWTRFTPSFINCIDFLHSGVIGDVRLIEADFCINPPYSPESRLFNPALGGGSLLDIGIYPVFFALETGSDVTGIKANATLDNNGIDTACAILMSHKRGELSVLCSSSTANGRIEALIHGSKGMLRLNKCWHTQTSLDLLCDGKEPQHLTFDSTGYGYQHEAAEVMRCIDAGMFESTVWTWDKSRRLISTLDTIRGLTGIRYSGDIEQV